MGDWRQWRDTPCPEGDGSVSCGSQPSYRDYRFPAAQSEIVVGLCLVFIRACLCGTPRNLLERWYSVNQKNSEIATWGAWGQEDRWRKCLPILTALMGENFRELASNNTGKCTNGPLLIRDWAVSGKQLELVGWRSRHMANPDPYEMLQMCQRCLQNQPSPGEVVSPQPAGVGREAPSCCQQRAPPRSTAVGEHSREPQPPPGDEHPGANRQAVPREGKFMTVYFKTRRAPPELLERWESLVS